MSIDKLYTLPAQKPKSLGLPLYGMVVTLLLGSWLITEVAAWLMRWHSALGTPLVALGGAALYEPWAWLVWTRRFGAAPDGWIWFECKILAVAISILSVMVAALLRRMSGSAAPASSVHGSARWAIRQEIVDAGLLPRTRKEKSASRGCYIGAYVNPKTTGLEYLTHDGPEHILAFAPTRSGKGVGLVLPTLLAWRHSAVVHDIKGEAWALSAGWRKAIGQTTIRFAPAEDGSAAYNPLEEIRIGTDRDVADAQNVAGLLVDPDGKGMEDHWAKTGHELLSAAMLHVLYSPAIGNKSLRGLISFFCDPSRDIEQIVTEMLEAVHDPDGRYGWRNPITDELTVTHPMIAESARSFLNKAENERSGVQSTAMSYLTLYRDPIVARNTSRSDFRIADLMNSEKPVSLYLVVPPNDMTRLKPLLRLLLSQIVRQTTEKMEFADGRSIKSYKHRLLLLIDEFPALGKLDIIEQSLAFVAGYGLKFYLIAQDLAQLYKAYTRDESVISNCHIRIAYAPNKIETAELLSKYCGQMTVTQRKKNRSGRIVSWMLPQVSISEQETARPLLTPDECLRLPGAIKSADGSQILEAGDMLILPAGANPIYGKQILYFKDPLFDGRSKITPPANTDRPHGPLVGSPTVPA